MHSTKMEAVKYGYMLLLLFAALLQDPVCHLRRYKADPRDKSLFAFVYLVALYFFFQYGTGHCLRGLPVGNIQDHQPIRILRTGGLCGGSLADLCTGNRGGIDHCRQRSDLALRFWLDLVGIGEDVQRFLLLQDRSRLLADASQS